MMMVEKPVMMQVSSAKEIARLRMVSCVPFAARSEYIRRIEATIGVRIGIKTTSVKRPDKRPEYFPPHLLPDVSEPVMETRTYHDTKIYRLFYPYQIGRIGNSALTMLLRNIFQILWMLTIIGGPIKYYEYSMERSSETTIHFPSERR